MEGDGEDLIVLPRPQSKLAPPTKQTHLLHLLTDDDALLATMADFASVARQRRTCLRRAIQFLHKLRVRFLNQANEDDDDDDALHGPRRTSLGGLALYVLSGKSIRGVITGVTTALKRASLDEVEAVLEESKSCDWAEETIFQLELASHLHNVREEAEKEREEMRTGEAGLSGPDRIESVRKRLLREQSSDTVKRGVAEWCSSVIQCAEEEEGRRAGTCTDNANRLQILDRHPSCARRRLGVRLFLLPEHAAGPITAKQHSGSVA